MIQQRENGVTARGTSLLVLLILLAGSDVLAAEGTASSPPQPSPAQKPAMEEVVVEAKKLYQMQKEIAKAQQRFFALYNELNTVRDFDERCDDTHRSGTMITQHTCKPVFYVKAEREDAIALLQGKINPLPPNMMWLARKEDYQKNMLEIVNKHPELLRLQRDINEMIQRYQKVRKERLKERWILFE